MFIPKSDFYWNRQFSLCFICIFGGSDVTCIVERVLSPACLSGVELAEIRSDRTQAWRGVSVSA